MATLRCAPWTLLSPPPLSPLRGFVLPSLVALSLALGACADDSPETSSEDEIGDATTSLGTDTASATSSATETADSDTGGDPYRGTPPQSWCPGGPSGLCDEVEGAPLRAGVAVLDLTPSCFETWTDVAQNGEFDEGEDDFIDCGCDRMCPADANYPGPDEGEGDGVFQAIYMAGFQNNRPATGIRGADSGLVGEGDGISCRALVLEQGDTRLAIVTIDTIGYFYDEVLAIRELIADSDIDWLVVHAVHNHEGPDTMGLWGEVFLEPGFDPDYRAQIRTTIAAAVAQAADALEDVGAITVGRGDASTAHQGQPDKGIRNVSNDTRDPFVVDEAVDVLHLANLEGQSIATLINYASHPESLASENTLLTADYIHALRRTVEQGSTWTQAPGKPGVGGRALFISGALGGMMTPLRITTTSPDGDDWETGQFEKADTIGQLIGELALEALAQGEPISAPQLEFAVQTFEAEVINDAFKLLFNEGIFDREVVERDGTQFVRSEMGIIELGPLRMITIPGELLPELAVGGYDGSQMFTSEVPLIDPENPNPPDLDQAPEGPYLKQRLKADYTWIIGLGNDELGYIIPEFSFELGFPAYLSEAEGDHYEETNSLGPHMAGIVAAQTQALVEFIDWL